MEEQRREAEKIGCKRAEVRALSKVTEEGSPEVSKEIAISAASESSGCMRMSDMPVLDQSVLRNVGRELSYRRRSGSETRASLRELKVERRSGVQAMVGMSLR